MSEDEIIGIVNDVLEEAGLLSLDYDIKLIEEEIKSLIPKGVFINSGLNISRIENEIRLSKTKGLHLLKEDKERKKHLNIDIGDMIEYMAGDDDIEYPISVKAIVITYLNIQNGANEKKAITALKGSLSNTFIGLHGMSLKKAGEFASETADRYFYRDTNTEPFNARKGGQNKIIDTDFGYILKLP